MWCKIGEIRSLCLLHSNNIRLSIISYQIISLNAQIYISKPHTENCCLIATATTTLQAFLISHFKSLMLTSSPAFSSYSYQSPSSKLIASNLVPESVPVTSQSPCNYVRVAHIHMQGIKHTSGLKSINSSPLQSKSMTFWAFGGEDC